jgi:ABC-2 type transport system ATP-binding protein
VVLLDEPTAGLDPIGREEMLTLVGRLAGFGISTLVATHLLDDVQRVCDQVVMIDGGKLRHASATRSLLHRTGAVRVDVHEGAARLADLLGTAGVAVTVVDDATLDVRVDGDDGRVLDLVRDGADDLGLALHSMTSRRTSLDELFEDETP